MVNNRNQNSAVVLFSSNWIFFKRVLTKMLDSPFSGDFKKRIWKVMGEINTITVNCQMKKMHNKFNICRT